MKYIVLAYLPCCLATLSPLLVLRWDFSYFHPAVPWRGKDVEFPIALSNVPRNDGYTVSYQMAMRSLKDEYARRPHISMELREQNGTEIIRAEVAVPSAMMPNGTLPSNCRTSFIDQWEEFKEIENAVECAIEIIAPHNRTYQLAFRSGQNSILTAEFRDTVTNKSTSIASLEVFPGYELDPEGLGYFGYNGVGCHVPHMTLMFGWASSHTHAWPALVNSGAKSFCSEKELNLKKRWVSNSWIVEMGH